MSDEAMKAGVVWDTRDIIHNFFSSKIYTSTSLSSTISLPRLVDFQVLSLSL